MRTFRDSFLLCLATICIASCDAPGEGAKAEAGKKLGVQVVDSLERYRIDNGRYPDELSKLFPQYIPTPLKEAGEGDTEGISFWYHSIDGETYELTFRYFGPGVNNCKYTFAAEPQSWNCSGHY